jgi:hypothetical protein
MTRHGDFFPARRVVLFASILVISVTRTPVAAAQVGGLEKLLDKVTDIGVFGSWGYLTPETPELDATHKLYKELGFELSFSVGAITCEAERVPRAARKRFRRHAAAEEDSVTQCVPKRNRATAAQRALALPWPVLRDTTWLFEIAIGYSQLSGFKSSDPGIDLRGSLRAAPMVSAYATRENWFLSPYFGLRSGLVQLQSLRVYQDTTISGWAATNTYSGAGSTFLGGVAAGVVKGIGPWNFFAEASYSWRNFSSVEWSSANSSKTVPANLPRNLDFRGASLSFGVQVSIADAKASSSADEKKSPD